MPKVRTYETQVSPNPLPNVRFSPNATADSFGGGKAKQISQLGAGLQNLGEGLGKVGAVFAARSQERKDKALVRNSLNQAESDMRVFEGDLNRPENREKAIDAYGSAQKELTEMRKRYSAQFKNERQRDLFTASFDSQMNGVLDRAFALQEKSRVEFDQLTRDAQNASAVDNAVAARTDANAIKNSEITIVANTSAATVGLPKDVRQKAIADARHNLHASVYSALLNDDPRAAQGYLEANKDKFHGAAYENLKKEADDKAFTWQAREDAGKLINAGLTDTQIEEEIAKIKDPKKAEAISTEVKRKLEDRNLAREIQQKENAYSSWQGVINGGDIPYGKLSGTEVKAMENYKRAALQGFAQQSDRGLLMQLGRLNDQELKSIDEVTMTSYGQKLAKDDFDAIFTRYRDLRRTNDVGLEPEKLTQIRTDSAMVGDALKALGVDPDLKKKTFFGEKAKKAEEKASDQQIINDATEAFQREINDAEKSKGRKLAPEEKRQILDDLLIKGKIRSLFGSKEGKFLFQTAEADLEKNFSIKDIPLKLQEQMQAAFKARGVASTPENIKNYYLEYLRRRKS